MKYIGKRRTIMGTDTMTDCEAIKYKLLKNEELILFKEEANRNYAIRLTPLHSPLQETRERILTSEKSLYHRLYDWLRCEMHEGIYTNQVNIQFRTKDLYYTKGLDIQIEQLEEPKEFTFSTFSDDANINMNYIQPFSTF